MEKYPKIQTVFLRDPATKHKTLLEGQFARPEFRYLADNRWLFTEKIDGTNIRVIWNADFHSVDLRGRADNSSVPPFLLDRLFEMLSVDLFESQYPETSMTLYGEGYGDKIQKSGGKYISGGVSFILFDVLIDEYWLQRDGILDIAEHLDIACVPLIGTGTLHEGIDLVRDGFFSLVSESTLIAEGLVMRPVVDLWDRAGRRIIAKVKRKDFRQR